MRTGLPASPTRTRLVVLLSVLACTERCLWKYDRSSASPSFSGEAWYNAPDVSTRLCVENW
eukprot:656184-Rhodomonas_salina.2